MLHQPDPNEKSDLFKGIIATRHLHLKAIEETGFACADEMLYPENYNYLDDILAYVAVGARSVEDQQHRLTASAIDVPVGMKNPTSGDYSVMMNAILAAQNSHTFIYRGWEVHSEGNQYAHAILRGCTNKHGEAIPNYHYEDIERLCNCYEEMDLVNPGLVVDTNHSNSAKNPFEQPRIIKEVLHSARHNEKIGKLLKGFMVESYIEDGAQKIDGGVYGKSITDPCLGWEKTERLIYDIAEML
jgi:3-deoxy-7-phosphoheptulonate synthase